MKFTLGDQLVTITRDPSLGTSLVSVKSMERELRKEKRGAMIELSHIKTGEILGRKIPGFLQQVIHKFQGVFKEPKGLPPRRHIEHQIVLQEGTTPVNVRPYRYPHFQKEEI